MVNVIMSLRSDPKFVAAAQKIHRADLENMINNLNLNLSFLVGFHNQLDYATRVKARTQRLDSRIEARLASAGDGAVEACKHMLEHIAALETMLRRSEIDNAINRLLPQLTRDFDDNKQVQATLAMFRSMGATEAGIKCARDELAKNHFDLLRFRGANGTITGLAASLKSKLDDLQHVVRVIHEQGIPTITGSGHGSFWSDPVTWIIIGVGILVVVGGTVVGFLAA